MKRAFLLIVVAVILAACKTAPTEIGDDLSQAELIQLAQESADAENWEAALAYYQAVLDRFPQDRVAAVTAQYEIAFIRYKNNETSEARAGFERVLALYDFEGETLPQWPRALAQRLLDDISAETEDQTPDAAATAAE